MEEFAGWLSRQTFNAEFIPYIYVGLDSETGFGIVSQSLSSATPSEAEELLELIGERSAIKILRGEPIYSPAVGAF